MSRFDRLRSGISTLQARLGQSAETVTRNTRIDMVSSGVDEIDPPEDIDEYEDQAESTGIVRKNLNKFTNDVWEPGFRLEGPDATVAYFMGVDEDEDAPSMPADVEMPEGGFLSQSFIYGGEKRQDFYFGAKETTKQRWVRGTVLHELLKADREDPESPIHGFRFIPPETVYPRVISNTNILLPPDEDALPDDIDLGNVERTPRGEIAAYVQFDDNSILGLRGSGFEDTDEVPLSQNDVGKQTLDVGIGDPNERVDGIFGTSVIEGITEEISEYKSIKRDRATAIKTKAYGIWTAQFNKEIHELPDGSVEIVEWDDSDMDALTSDIEDSGPGDIITHDGNVEPDRLEANVPDLDDTLKHYVEDILAPLPAPKYKVGFSDDINRDVTGEQNDDYTQTVAEEREYQERYWTQIFRRVAERNGLEAEGLQFKIGPKPSDSPVESLTQEEIDKFATYAEGLAALAGQGGPRTLVDTETLLTDIAQLPEDVAEEVAGDLEPVDEDAEAQRAFADQFGIETQANRYSEGDEVDTPDGLGVVVDAISESFEEPGGDQVDASSDSPAYAVILEDGRKEIGFYKASDLSADTIDVDVQEPEGDLESMRADWDDDGVETMQEGHFSWPDSWEASDQPARLIALKAFAGMGGSFDGCEREMRGNVATPERFCGAFIDRLVGNPYWRGDSWAPGD